jgi:hypothetical protein
MRKIKFRAYAHASKVMFYPDSEDGWELVGGKLSPLPNTTIMQYTGLKDKNGTEIYEGDIVKDSERLNESGVMEWDEKTASFFIGGTNVVESGLVYRHWVVTGNIYKNPELLKED